MPLIETNADVGRLCNKFFGFFALADQVADPEPGLATLLVSGTILQAYATTGRISCPGQIGLLYLAAVHPRVRELCRRMRLPDGAVADLARGRQGFNPYLLLNVVQ